MPDFEPCTIGTGATKLAAQCTTLTVPLDRDDAASPNLELSIARIPARRQSGRQDVFTLLAGGPGQSAIETFPSIALAFRHIMRDRDVILLDQRGTGNSHALRCPEARESLGIGFERDSAEMAEAARTCLTRLEYDPRHFTTSAAIRDLEQLRDHLGIPQWNLYGISYGTRVALHYLRRYPDRVRTMILDAVVPPTIALGPDIPVLAQRALDLIFQRCADTIGCAQAFGPLGADTRKLLSSLRQQPRSITYEDVTTGRIETLDFTWQHLAVTLRLLSYSSQTAAILPSMLHEAIHNDNFAPLARQALMQAQTLGDTMATGMHNAVICSEDVPYMQSPGTAEASHADASTDSYLGNDIIESLQAVCAIWPVGDVDADFREAVESDVPTLILSGEADPITPPAYGEQAAAGLSRSRHIVNRHQGHMQAPFGCMPSLMAQFVETADSTTLDTGCLARMRVLPFFVDANGPLP